MRMWLILTGWPIMLGNGYYALTGPVPAISGFMTGVMFAGLVDLYMEYFRA